MSKKQSSNISDNSGISYKQALVCGIGASASWGFSTVMTKGVLEHIDPIALLFLQLVASNVFLWIVLRARQIRMLPFWKNFKVGLPGLLQPGISYSLGLVGLSLTNASIDSLIWSTESIIIIILARFILGEKLNNFLIILSIVAGLGIMLITINFDENTIFKSSSLVGNVLILIATFCAALYTIISRKLVTSINSLLLVTLNQSIGLIGVFFIFIISQTWSGTSINLNSINPNNWCLIIASGITLHGLPFWLHTMVLEDLEASISAFFITLIPVFAIIGSYLFLGERLSIVQWIGTALILFSVVIASSLKSE